MHSGEEDPWAPFRGKYEEPTQFEYLVMGAYAKTFPFENDDFVESVEWKNGQEKIGMPDSRQVLIELLHQIRESKGYEVEHFVDFFCPFVPQKDAEEAMKEEAAEAAATAIRTINAQTIGKKIYELVNLDYFVWTLPNRSFLLTLKVKEANVAVDVGGDVTMVDPGEGVVLKTIRAAVFAPKGEFHLIEWKFKP